MNPLAPTLFESLVAVLLVFALVLTVYAVISVLRSRIVTGRHRVLWLLVVLLVPVLGAGLWFYASRRMLSPLTDRR